MKKHLNWVNIWWTIGLIFCLAVFVSLVEFAFLGIDDIIVLLWTYPINILFVLAMFFILLLSEMGDIYEIWDCLKKQYYHGEKQ